MSNVTLRVNGKSRTVDVDPATPLLYILRNELSLRGRDLAATGVRRRRVPFRDDRVLAALRAAGI